MNCGNMKLSLRSIYFCPNAWIPFGVQVFHWKGVEIHNIFYQDISRTENGGHLCSKANCSYGC